MPEHRGRAVGLAVPGRCGRRGSPGVDFPGRDFDGPGLDGPGLDGPGQNGPGLDGQGGRHRAEVDSPGQGGEHAPRRTAHPPGGLVRAQIVCTTESFLDGYAIEDKTIPLAQYRELGEPIPAGPYFRKLAALADELDIHLIAGMLEADGMLRYNTAVLLGPEGQLIGKYRKQKLGHELVRNSPGRESPVFATPFGKVSLMICADRTDPKIVGRLCSAGADFLICPSGGMFGPVENDPIVQGRSSENGIYIVFVHPVEFLVTGPDGQICAPSWSAIEC